MKTPSLKTRMLGHPLVVWPSIGFFLWTGYMLLTGPDTWPLAAIALFFGAPVMRAYERREEWLAWRKAWNAMSGQQPPRRRRFVKPLTGLMVVAAAALYLVATLDRTDSQTVLAISLLWMVGVVAFFAGRGLWRRLRRTRRATAGELVKVCVRKPLLRVPSLQQAYAALPDHCRAVMGGRQP
ncbi:hypothetical protein [Sphingobium lactosutens]|uniref:Uncharacterized protein n=1 Tax=Sphingobium lactosutens DS20 TaxID=1331060 RepID=T0IYJ0_9SPHN|nr:hypothetical protein [Sphingobium lactosutens]EQB16945.1 hypothetical protein RLDS_05785 [Sphingobium lactosutens DS20]